MVHRAHRAPGHGGIHQGLVRPAVHGPCLGPGRPGWVHVQHQRGLRPGRHPNPQAPSLHRRHEGRLPHRHLPGMRGGHVPPVPRGRGFLPQYPRPHRYRGHRIHPPRLPARGDRGHRLLSHHGKGSQYLCQVQPHHPGLRMGPQAHGRYGLRLRILYGPAL